MASDSNFKVRSSKSCLNVDTGFFIPVWFDLRNLVRFELRNSVTRANYLVGY